MLAELDVKGILYAVAITVVFVAVLALLRLLFKKLSARVEATLARSDWAFKIQQLELLSAEGFKIGLV